MQERFRRVPRPKGDGDMQAPPRSQYMVRQTVLSVMGVKMGVCFGSIDKY